MLSHFKQRWLSSDVQRRLRDEFPELALPSTSQAWYDRANDFLPLKTLALIFAAWVGVMIPNELLTRAGYEIFNFNIDVQNMADFFASMLEYLAALVGIAIPVIILVIEFVGRDASSVIDVYFDRTQVKRTAITSLILLAGITVLNWLTRIELLVGPMCLFYLSLLALLFGLAVVFHIIDTILQVRKSLSSEFLLSAILATLRARMKESYRAEVEFRLGRLEHIGLCRSSGIATTQSPIQPPKTIAVRISKSGVIKDVNIKRFRELQRLVGEANLEKPRLTRLMGDKVSNNDIIMYVDLALQHQIASLQQLLMQTLEVTEVEHSDSEIGRLLWQMESIAKGAIRDLNEQMLQGVFELYSEIITSGVKFPNLPTIDWPLDAFRSWNPSLLAIRHIRTLFEQAAADMNERFVYLLAQSSESIVSDLIKGSASGIDRNLSGMLGMCITIYDVSRKNEPRYEAFVPRLSSRQLPSDFLVHAMIITARHAQSDGVISSKEALTNAGRVYNEINRTLAELARRMVLQSDARSLGKLLDDLNPDQVQKFVAPFDTIYWRRPVAGTTIGSNSYNTENLRIAEGFHTEYQNYFEDLIYLLYCYTCEGFDRNEFDALSTKQTTTVLVPYFSSIQTTLEKLQMMLSQVHLLRWEMFERYEQDGLTAKGLGFRSMLILGYCLRGIQVASHNEDEIDLQPTMISPFDLKDIAQKCKEIRDRAEAWSQVLEISSTQIRDGANKFLSLNYEIDSRWNERASNDLVKAELDPELEKTLKAVVMDVLDSHSSLRRLLTRHDAFVELDDNENGELLRVSYSDAKQFYVASLGKNAKSAASQHAQWLLRMEDSFIVQRLLHLGTPIEHQTNRFDESLDKALQSLEESDYSSVIIVFPTNLRPQILLDLEDFHESVWDASTESEASNFRGKYRGIPIMEMSFGKEPSQILVVDLARAVKLEVGGVMVKVATLTDREIEERLKNDPNLTERRLRLLVTVEIKEQVAVNLMNDQSILWIKPPDEWLA